MKDIQEQVYNTLLSVTSVDSVYSDRPQIIFDETDEVVVVFYEIENSIGLLVDNNVEEFSVIYYNFDIYSKNQDTYIIRDDINESLSNLGFVRISSSQEIRTDDYYNRLLSYRISL